MTGPPGGGGGGPGGPVGPGGGGGAIIPPMLGGPWLVVGTGLAMVVHGGGPGGIGGMGGGPSGEKKNNYTSCESSQSINLFLSQTRQLI